MAPCIPLFTLCFRNLAGPPLKDGTAKRRKSTWFFWWWRWHSLDKTEGPCMQPPFGALRLFASGPGSSRLWLRWWEVGYLLWPEAPGPALHYVYEVTALIPGGGCRQPHGRQKRYNQKKKCFSLSLGEGWICFLCLRVFGSRDKL